MAQGSPNKRRATWMLEALDRRGWLNSAACAVLAGYPIRVATCCLVRLHRRGLIRRRDARGLSLYAISNLAGGRSGPEPGQPADSRQSPEEKPPAALRGTISAGQGVGA